MGGSGLDRTDDFQQFCGSGLDRIEFHRIRAGIGLKNFTVRSSLPSGREHFILSRELEKQIFTNIISKYHNFS